jgi:hypothetical protein
VESAKGSAERTQIMLKFLGQQKIVKFEKKNITLTEFKKKFMKEKSLLTGFVLH